MADDLFEELDRFQQSIQNIPSSDAHYERQEQHSSSSHNQHDPSNTLIGRHRPGSRYWPSEIQSSAPILHTFDEELLSRPDRSPDRTSFYVNDGYQTTYHKPVSTTSPLDGGATLHLNRGFGQANTSSPNMTPSRHPRAVSKRHQQAVPNPDQGYLYDGRNTHAALRQSSGLPGGSPFRAPHVVDLPDQTVLSGDDRSFPPVRSMKLSNQPPIIQGICLVPTHELPDRIRNIFSFPLFNAVQSKCFGPIFKTDDNFVLSAPTGSGKTGVLELAICRLMITSANKSFKIVYQAPTKSLCSERQRDWQSKFRSLGLQCAELTGDTTQNQLHEVQHASIIITTPEKWDSITRKWKDRAKLMQMVKLFLIDEIHILKEERGATLEAVVSRMMSMGSDVRFVAVSATIPNSQDIATWLGAQMERFGEDFRPVKLQKYVCGYQGGANDFGFDKALNAKLPDVIIKWSQRKPLMVFCSTRRSCIDTAKLLSNWWASKEPTNRFWTSPRRHIAVTDKDLHGVVPSGVAFHHAGLTAEDRSTVERSYLVGDLNVICCTSTLAVGINLPCHMVIIKGTVTYQGHASGGAGACREYSDLEVMQMLGRAGRPQFDKSAVAVIMTRVRRVTDYENIITGQEVLESSLHRNLIDHINAEIGLGTVTDSMSAKKWLMGTFLYVRLKANPKHYQLNGDSRKQQSVDEQLGYFCTKAISQLEESQLVVCDPHPKCTEFGDAMARYCIRFDTMKAFLSLSTKPKVSEILSVISKAVEFKEVRIRPGDKSVYRELNKNQSIKFPVSNSLESPSHKISLIIQCVLGAAELPTEDSKLRVDFQTCKAIIFNHLTRLIRCIIDCQLHLGDSIGTRNALMLARSFGAQVWDDSPLHLKQLEGIGFIGVRKLVNANIKSIEDLQTVEAHQIEHALSRNPPWGTQLQSKAATFPRLHVSLSLKGEPIVNKDHGVVVRVRVDLGFVNEKTPSSFQRKAVYVCLLVDTTVGNVVHFGRISATKLGDGQDILISVNMTSSDQAIRAFVMCDEIAGTARQAILKPDIPANAFILPIRKSQHEITHGQVSNEANTSRRRVSNNEEKDQADNEFDDDQLADEDLVLLDTDQFKDIEDFDEVNMSDYEPQVKTQQSRPRVNAAVLWEPQQLENGNWACNHSCINKKACKHRCCQEGIEKKPKPPKFTKSKNTDCNFSPIQQRLDVSLTTNSISTAGTTQHHTSIRGRKRSLQTVKAQSKSNEIPNIPSSTFILPGTMTENRSKLKTIPRFKRAHAGFTKAGKIHIESLSSDDVPEYLDSDFVKDSSAAASQPRHRENKLTEIESSDDLNEYMSGALPSIEGIETIDLSNVEDVNTPPLRISSTPLLNISDFGSAQQTAAGLGDADVTDTATQQGIFVSDRNSISQPLSNYDEEAPTDTRSRGRVASEEPSSIMQGAKKQKLSGVERPLCVTLNASNEETGSRGASSGIEPAVTTLKPDHELDLEEWFHRHLGAEHFNYIG